MILAIHKYDSLELVGRLKIDDVLGGVSFLDGSLEIQSFADSHKSGFVRDTTVVEEGKAYAVTRVPLPREPRFELLVNRSLVERGWCTEWMTRAIREHPNFRNHPWRIAHR